MPTLPKYNAKFGSEQVELYLMELSEYGWEVFEGNRANHYYIVLGEEKKVELCLIPGATDWLVTATKDGSMLYHKKASTFLGLRQRIEEAAEKTGSAISAGPSSIRLGEGTPISNRRGFVHLTHGSKVECIFDPYFEDKSIVTISTMANLGMRFGATLRVLTTSRKQSRITPSMVEGFRKEHSCEISLRLCASPSEHRRFMLLSTGSTLVFGPSLNSLDKNEAAHVETSNADRAFFEEQWEISTSFVASVSRAFGEGHL